MFGAAVAGVKFVLCHGSALFLPQVPDYVSIFPIFHFFDLRPQVEFFRCLSANFLEFIFLVPPLFPHFFFDLFPLLCWQRPSVTSFRGGNTLLPSQGGSTFQYNHIPLLDFHCTHVGI